MQKLGLSLLLCFSILALVACGSSSSPTASGFKYTIDPSVSPSTATLNDGKVTHTLAAVEDASGAASIFITDEVLISPTDASQLTAFLTRYGATVVANDAVPQPPARLGVTLDPTFAKPTQYAVHVDASSFGLANFASDAAKAKIHGQVRFSSDAAAHLLALVVHEQAGGLQISPNFVFFGQSLLTSSEEQPTGSGGFDNAFSWSEFGPTGNRSDVTDAWTYMSGRQNLHPVFVAVIDGGFWLDGAGHPMSALDGLSDLPSDPLEYDFAQDDYIADGVNLNSCTAGFVCNFHGNGTAGIATGKLNNRYGAAGTGGQVAQPMLFKTDLAWDQVARAIRTAVAWHADVISMSFGANCDNVFCDGYFEFNLYPALRAARDGGLVTVAAAGNDSQDANGKVPCKGDSVICVGALDQGVNTAAGYSDFDSRVNIWAPGHIHVMPDGDVLAVHTSDGTSEAAPFISGIAAMLRAMNPNLDSDSVNTLLQQTAWKDSTDPKVTAYVNAFAAVKAVGGAPPTVQITAPADNATIDFENNIASGTTLTGVVKDAKTGADCCTLAWSSDKDGALGTGKSLHVTFHSPGARVITAIGTSSQGAVAQAQIHVNVLNTAPTANIQAPTDGEHLFAGISYPYRAQTLLSPGKTLTYAWTVTQPDNSQLAFSGATPNVTLNQIGTNFVSLTVTDNFGAKGSDSVAVTVDTLPPAPTVTSITLNGLTQDNYDVYLGVTVDVAGQAAGQAQPLQYRWTWQNTDNAQCPEVTLATTQSFSWDTTANASECVEYGYGKLTLYVTDANQQVGSESLVVRFVSPPN
jgi:Subtilase family